MCGIAGFVDPQTAPADRLAAVEKMCAAMTHRGPDDGGIYALGEATLGMRRLAIFDPANGQQPLVSPDGRYTLVFNGSIINFRSLRPELAAGWEFRTDCDTEVLLAAYARWGEQCLRRLRGMFAFAVWDAQQHSLFLARDPFGIKPLYYRAEGGRLQFASEINGLLAGGGSSEIDALSAADYLSWFSVPPPRTIYRGVFSLRPGERALFRGGRLDFRRFWGFDTIPASSPCRSRPEFIQELRRRLEETIGAHAVADVPVGTFLSGGLDSAVVAGLMARAVPGRLRTFTIDFAEKEFSEAEAAAQTAHHLGADHDTHLLTGAEVAGDIEKFLSACDQPTGDGLNTYYASRLARERGMTVSLSGLGGDELFGGYPSFHNLPRLAAWLRWWQILPAALRGAIVARLRRGGSRERKLADCLRYAHDVQELASMQRRVLSEPRRRSLLEPQVAEAVGHRAPFHPELLALRTELAHASTFEIASAWELRGYMADLLLRDSDVMSMRHSLELRVPLVDRPFIEWLWCQPTAFKSVARHPKGVLAEAAGDLLRPHLQRQSKLGFSLPMEIWMRRELKPFLDETFSDANVNRSGLFVRPAVQSFWRGFLDGHDTREWSRVWSLAVLIAFVNRKSAPSVQTARLGVRIESSPARAPARPPSLTPAAASAIGPCTLLMTPEIFSSVGGIPRILQIYLRALSEMGKSDSSRLRLISLNDPQLDSGDIRRCTDHGLDDWFVCDRRKSRFVREAFRMSRGCDRILCGHVAQLPVVWMIRRLRPQIRYYVVAHGIEVWRPFSLLEKLALRGAEKVFCVSDFTRRELLKYCPLRPGRAVVLPNALDPFFEIGPGRPLDECPPVILTVTRLSYNDRYKGVEHLILAMKALRAALPGARLRIVGQGDDRRRLTNIARGAGLGPEAVEFLGHVDDKRLAEELASCRLLALPSRKEGFGIVYLEAMASGRPCLGANAGGTPEVITGETGILVEFGDVEAIARGCLDALQRTWNQEAILERVRNFSYNRFKERLAAQLAP